MSRTRIKICGLTSAADAREAVAAGADALGVVLADSPRRVEIAEAAELFAGVPPFVARVGVFVNAAEEVVARAVRQLGLHAVQFHGDETPERCAAAPAPVIKAFRVGSAFAPGVLEPFRGHVAAALLDTDSPDTRGGTGKAFSWDLVTALPGWAPFVVAGGLNPHNVAEVIHALHPFAVDVSSGVEDRVREKDHAALHSFVEAVRRADEAASRS